MLGDDLARDAEPESGPLALGLGREERLEDARQHVGRHPGTVVDDTHDGAVTVDERLDRDRSLARERLLRAANVRVAHDDHEIHEAPFAERIECGGERGIGDEPRREQLGGEALRGGRGQEAFFSTCCEATAEQVLTWYSWRWSIEQTIRDSKQHLGFEEPQGYTRAAVQRTAPIAMLLYSLIVHWFVSYGHLHYTAPMRPWYRQKAHASFADMLRTLRRESAYEQIIPLGLSGQGSRKILQIFDHVLQLAA